MDNELHRTQKFAEEILVRFEKEGYELQEGLMVLALVLRCVGMSIKAGPKVMMNTLNRVLLRLAQTSKPRDNSDTIWTPKGIARG